MSALSDHESVAAQLGAYFDGELEADDERAVLDHLADCERCQTALDDLMGMHVALGRDTAALTSTAAPSTTASPSSRLGSAPRDVDAGAKVIPLAPRRARRQWAIAGVALAAAAAMALVVVAPWRKPRSEPQLALADTRPVEVRFTAHDFSTHRPYRVDRGGPSVTPLPLATLSALERRGDRAALIAALVWSGERARADSILEHMPVDPRTLTDRAAVAVLDGAPEVALEAADRALLTEPTLAAARWNRALALRDLGLPLAAAAELEGLAATGEPGWSIEAAERARALRQPIETRRAARLDASARRRAAIAGGPALTALDVETAPTTARHYFHDALRIAGSRAEVDALAPLAAALDRQSGGTECADELARVSRLDLARRAMFATRYRDVAAGKLSGDEVDRLVADLAAKGAELDDIRLGVIVLGRRMRQHLADVERIAEASGNPWFLLLAIQERAADDLRRPDDPALVERWCGNPAWALRCAAIADEQVAKLVSLGRTADAERLERHRLELLATGSTGVEERPAYIYLAEILRARGRYALAAATLAEVLADPAATDCVERRRLETALAELHRRRGDLVATRGLLEQPDACPTGITVLDLGTAVDLARDSRESGDRAIAERWLAAGHAAGLPPLLLDVAGARLHIIDDPTRSQRILLDAATPRGSERLDEAIADWASRTLIADDGRRGEWQAVIDHTLVALGQKNPTRCVIALATDDAITTAAWRDAAGVVGGSQWRAPSPWPPLSPSALADCTSIAVVALAPLHGRPPPWAHGVWSWNSGRAIGPAAAMQVPRPLIVAATAPAPEQLDLPPLAPVAIPAGNRGLTGVDATPSRVAVAMADATYVEIHAHGLVDLDSADGGFIALSPDTDGDWRLTATDVRALKLAAAPVVVLAACRAAEAAPDQLRRWSLPDAFLAAGARAVIAADVEVPDDLIRAFVDDVRGRLERGEAPAVAAAAARAALIARDPKSASWVDRLMVFE